MNHWNLEGVKVINKAFKAPLVVGYKGEIGSFIRDVIDSTYLQIRDNVCAGIESHLDQELRDGFSTMFEKFLHKRVEQEVTKSLPYLTEEGKQ